MSPRLVNVANVADSMKIQPPAQISNHCLDIVHSAVKTLSEEREAFRQKVIDTFEGLERVGGQLEREMAAFESQESQVQNELKKAFEENEQLQTVFSMLEESQLELEKTRAKLLELNEKASAFNGKLELENQQLKLSLEQGQKEIDRLTELVDEQSRQLNSGQVEWGKELRSIRTFFESRPKPVLSDVTEKADHTDVVSGPDLFESKDEMRCEIERESDQDSVEFGDALVDDDLDMDDAHRQDTLSSEDGHDGEIDDACTNDEQVASGGEVRDEFDDFADDFSDLDVSQSAALTAIASSRQVDDGADGDGGSDVEGGADGEGDDDIVLGAILAQFQKLESNVSKLDG